LRNTKRSARIQDDNLTVSKRYKIELYDLLFLHGTDGFAEVSKNLASYRSENNFV